MTNADTHDDPTGGLMSALRRNPVLYLDLQSRELVILQQETIAALRAKSFAKRFHLPPECKEGTAEAKRVLTDETGRYLRMPGVRMPEARQWIGEFSEGFLDLKTRYLISRAARQSRTLSDFAERLSQFPYVREEWLDFKAQKLMQSFAGWANVLPIFPVYALCSFDGGE